MRPIEFHTFPNDVENILKELLNQFKYKVIVKDRNSFYCENNNSALLVYYEGSTLQFIIIDNFKRQSHIYEILKRKGLDFLIPVSIDSSCVELLKEQFPKDTYIFYLEDICWLNKISKIIIQYCQDEFTD